MSTLAVVTSTRNSREADLIHQRCEYLYETQLERFGSYSGPYNSLDVILDNTTVHYLYLCSS